MFSKMAFFCVVLGSLNMNSANADSLVHHYVVADFGLPTSFDPLDADNGENLFFSRMIYLTPL